MFTELEAKRAIKEIKTSGLKLDKLVQSVSLYAIFQANTHGNTNSMNQLVSALNKSSRKEALCTYLRDFSKVAINSKTKLFEYRKDRKIYNGTVEITIVEAQENATKIAFYDYTKEVKPITSYDVLTRLQSLIKTAKSFDGTVEHKTMLSALEKLVEAETKATPLNAKANAPKAANA